MNGSAYCWTGMGKTEKASQDTDVFSCQSSVLPECPHPYQGYGHAFTVWAQGQGKPWTVTGQGGEMMPSPCFTKWTAGSLNGMDKNKSFHGV